MSFRDEAQQIRCFELLCESVGLAEGRIWKDGRPTDELCDLAEGRGSSLSSGQQAVALITLDLWNGRGRGQLAHLDFRTLDRVGWLLRAMTVGRHAIDSWEAEVRRQLRNPPAQLEALEGAGRG